MFENFPTIFDDFRSIINASIMIDLSIFFYCQQLIRKIKTCNKVSISNPISDRLSLCLVLSPAKCFHKKITLGLSLSVFWTSLILSDSRTTFIRA